MGNIRTAAQVSSTKFTDDSVIINYEMLWTEFLSNSLEK